MRIHTRTLALASIVTLSLSAIPFGAAQAGGGLFPVGTSVDKPWYIGAAIGASRLEPNVLTTGGSVINNASEGIQVYGGYKFTHRFAVEAFYADLGNAEIDVVTDTSDVDYQTYGVALVASHPVTNKVSLFAKLGYAMLENEVKSTVAYRQVESGTVYKGIGVEYKVKENVSLRLAYDHYDKDYQFLSLGVQVNFGQPLLTHE